MDELRTPPEGHGLAGGVGEIGHSVDDVVICFTPWSGRFEDLVLR